MATFVADFMNKVSNISKHKHSVGIVLGVFTALIMLFTQVFYFDYVADSKAEVKTEQSEDANDTSNDLTISQDAVSSVVQVNINQTLHFISEIRYTITKQADFEIRPVPDLNKFFKALFNLIISPNAP